MSFSGHCLCGNVSFEVAAEPKWVAHCHCESCRRHTGSVMATFAGTLLHMVNWTGAMPARYESSPDTWRSFCARCGSPISYESSTCPGEIHFYHGTLADPQDRPATVHVFAAEQLPWFEVLDDCPRFGGSGGADAKTLLRKGPRAQSTVE